jgi:hypothetical protein
MGSYRFISPVVLFNATVTNPTVVSSTALDLRTLVGAAFQLNVGAGLTATVQVLGSLDNSNWFDMGVSLPAIAGSAIVLGINMYQVTVPYVKVQITPSGGAGTVVVYGCAKAV